MSNNDQDGSSPCKRLRLDADAVASVPAEDQPFNDAAEDQQPSGSNNVPRPVVVPEPELSERLCNVLTCIVCLDLPHPDENYQCSRGHIICENCVTRLLAEANLKCSDALCPHCRIPISWKQLTKNLAVGQTLWELPNSCVACHKQLDYKSLDFHLKKECGKRLVECRYRCLGCTWKGCHEDSVNHETTCKSPKMSGDKILTDLNDADEQDQWDNRAIHQCYRSLSAQRIFYEDLELRGPQAPYVQSLTEWKFHTGTIFAFENTWRLRLRVLIDSCKNYCISYRVTLISTPRGPVKIKYFVTLPAISVNTRHLRDVKQELHEDQFAEARQRGDYKQLPMSCPAAPYRLLAMSRLKLRLWMILH